MRAAGRKHDGRVTGQGDKKEQLGAEEENLGSKGGRPWGQSSSRRKERCL